MSSNSNDLLTDFSTRIGEVPDPVTGPAASKVARSHEERLPVDHFKRAAASLEWGLVTLGLIAGCSKLLERANSDFSPAESWLHATLAAAYLTLAHAVAGWVGGSILRALDSRPFVSKTAMPVDWSSLAAAIAASTDAG